MEARVEFLKGFDSPHPIERTVPPMIRVFGTWNSYKYPKISGHELMYKNIISGLELEVIYNNVKRQYDQSSRNPTPNSDSDSDSDSSGTPFHKPFTIDVQTVIIYTLEGAKAFFAILEDRCLLLSCKYAIYDPRDSLYPRSFPTLIDKDTICLTLYRTVHSTEPPVDDSGVIRTVYCLLADLTWRKVQPEELPTTPFSPCSKQRRIITEDLIIPRAPGTQA